MELQSSKTSNQAAELPWTSNCVNRMNTIPNYLPNYSGMISGALVDLEGLIQVLIHWADRTNNQEIKCVRG